ncbi:lipocalin family protein [Nocardia salmonicida]|uniref:lipocalin family protein n=1 Tax=Nocardia sp. PE-7 TaxID=3058426 RepID=UPI002657FF71|nr:lipocalin family protein [Nocardia sp. PE-7]WKG13223.1 lipocalin family protein [Nocardia sp. PE-7]
MLIAVGLSVAGTATAAAEPPAPVPSLELDRYLGEWRQLAAVPQPFNLNCARDTTATYTLDPAGDVGVFNRCRTWTGGVDEIRGTATVNDPVTNAQLHVSFPGVPGQDGRQGDTNYIVTALGPDYSWALVTSPSRLSGFVLSRTPALDDATWQQIDEAIRIAGQDPCIYLTSPTTGGREGVAPLCAR